MKINCNLCRKPFLCLQSCIVRNTYLNIVGWKASEEAEAALELDSGAETGGTKLGRAEGGGIWDNRLPSPSATHNIHIQSLELREQSTMYVETNYSWKAAEHYNLLIFFEAELKSISWSDMNQTSHLNFCHY